MIKYIKATRTAPPYITINKIYQVVEDNSSSCDSYLFIDDRGEEVSVNSNKPDWVIPYIHKNIIGGKLL